MILGHLYVHCKIKLIQTRFQVLFFKLQKLIAINKPASVQEQAPFSPLVLRVKQKPKKASALAALDAN